MESFFEYRLKSKVVDRYTLQSGDQFYRIEVYDNAPDHPIFEATLINSEDLEAWGFMDVQNLNTFQVIQNGKRVKSTLFPSYKQLEDGDEYFDNLVIQSIDLLAEVNKGKQL